MLLWQKFHAMAQRGGNEEAHRELFQFRRWGWEARETKATRGHRAQLSTREAPLQGENVGVHRGPPQVVRQILIRECVWANSLRCGKNQPKRFPSIWLGEELAALTLGHSACFPRQTMKTCNSQGIEYSERSCLSSGEELKQTKNGNVPT